LGPKVASHGGKADERVVDMRADVPCKENYAACVKEIMPYMPDHPIEIRHVTAIVPLYNRTVTHAGPRLG
jgi:hypothetical protein